MNWGDRRLPERFWSRVVPEPNSGCWLWIGHDNTTGYGRYRHEARTVYPHRLALSVATGAVPVLRGPDGLVVDHLCRNTLCVNPAHLEAVTLSANNARGDLGRARGCVRHNMATKTHCKHGHAFTPENTAIRHGGDHIHRACRECDRQRAQRNRNRTDEAWRGGAK